MIPRQRFLASISRAQRLVAAKQATVVAYLAGSLGTSSGWPAPALRTHGRQQHSQTSLEAP